jgi:hypothetical protein
VSATLEQLATSFDCFAHGSVEILAILLPETEVIDSASPANWFIWSCKAECDRIDSPGSAQKDRRLVAAPTVFHSETVW